MKININETWSLPSKRAHLYLGALKTGLVLLFFSALANCLTLPSLSFPDIDLISYTLDTVALTYITFSLMSMPI